MYQEEEIEISGQVVKLIHYEEVDESHESEMEPETTFILPGKSPKRKNSSSKGPIGRRLQDVWNEFEVTILSPTKKMTVCRHCSKKTSDGARAYRLREHLMKCDKYLECFDAPSSSISNINKTNQRKGKLKNDRQVKVVAASTQSLGPGSRSSGDVKVFGRKSSPLLKDKNDISVPKKNAIKDVISGEKQKLSRLLVRFLISTKIPFNIIKNEEFKGFIKMLRPDYTLPAPETLNGLVFETVYNELRAECDRELRGEKVVLVQSGWSNSSTSVKRLITHSLQQGSKIYFFNTVEVSSLEISVQICETLIRETISMAETDFGCKVIGVVVDNINYFLEVKSLLEAYDSSLLVHVSLLHLLLYVGHSLIDDEVLDKVVKVYKYFRSYDYQCNRMMEEINRSVETRWNNDQNALAAYIRDRERYLEILTDPTYQNSNGRIQMTEPIIQIERKANDVEEVEFLEILNDLSLKQKANEMITALAPLQISLELLYKDGCSLADGVSCWLSWIKNSVLDNEHILSMVDIDQYKKIAITPPGLTAYMLSPKYKGLLLTEDEVETGREYILSINVEYLDPVAAFMQSDDSMYPKSLIKEIVCKTMDPIRWWKEQIRNTKLPTGFVQFALSLINLPANVSSLERCFSS